MKAASEHIATHPNSSEFREELVVRLHPKARAAVNHNYEAKKEKKQVEKARSRWAKGHVNV